MPGLPIDQRRLPIKLQGGVILGSMVGKLVEWQVVFRFPIGLNSLLSVLYKIYLISQMGKVLLPSSFVPSPRRPSPGSCPYL